MGADGNITVVTTGMLPMVILAAALLTAPAALVLLRLYRRAVARSMADSTADAGLASGDAPAIRRAASQPLRIHRIDATAEPDEPALYRRTRRSLLMLAAVYAAAGLAYALVFASAWTILAGEGLVLTRFLWLAACYAWPAVLAVAIVHATRRHHRGVLAGGYFLLVGLMAAYASLRNPELTLGSLGFFWIYANGAPTLLFLSFLQRRVRAVGPLVLAFMVAAVTGSQLLLSVVGASDYGMRIAVDLGGAFGWGGTETFFVILVAGFCLFGLVGWRLLQRLGERYRRRRTSDQALMLDAMWLMFGIVQSITLSFEGPAWLLTGLAAFALYKLVALTGFGLLRRETDDAGCTLLLLRVFALGRRSERLFDALAKWWLRAGSIRLIAGPDLVASTLAPHEFLAFVGGELSRRFVRDRADLERRMRAMAEGRDPDGRYRVNEFLCYADTWQTTMRRLALGVDAVLMDLRGFAPDNQGCLYEIEQLLAGVDLRRVLLLIDATTDQGFLESALHSAWERVGMQAPAARDAAPEVRLLDAGDDVGRSLPVLLKLLLAERAEPLEARAGSAVPT